MQEEIGALKQSERPQDDGEEMDELRQKQDSFE